MNLLEISYRLYSGLLERISSRLAARVDDLKEQYGSTIDPETFEYLSRNDPSGNHKYLAWMCKQSLDQSAESVVNAVNVFDANIGKLHKRDLNQYPRVESIYDAIRDVARKNLSTITVFKNSQMIYPESSEPTRWAVVTVPNHAAMKFYGTGTKWCVAQKKPKYYKQYTEQGKFFVLFDLLNKSSKYAIYWRPDQRPEVWEPSDTEVGHGHLEEVSGSEYKKIFDSISKQPGVDPQPWEDLKELMEEYKNSSYDQIKDKIKNVPRSNVRKIISALPKRTIEQLYYDTDLMSDEDYRRSILEAQTPAFLDSKFDDLGIWDKIAVVHRLPIRRVMTYYKEPHQLAVLHGYTRTPQGKKKEYGMKMFLEANPKNVSVGIIKELEDDGFDFTKIPTEKLIEFKDLLTHLKPENAVKLEPYLGEEFFQIANLYELFNASRKSGSKVLDMSFLKTAEGRNAFRRINEISPVDRIWKPSEVKAIMKAYDLREEPLIREGLLRRRMPKDIEDKIHEIVVNSDNMTMGECKSMMISYDHMTLKLMDKIRNRMEFLASGSFMRELEFSYIALQGLSYDEVQVLADVYPDIRNTRSYIYNLINTTKDVNELIKIHDSFPIHAKMVLNTTIYDNNIKDYWKLILHMCRKGTINHTDDNDYTVSHLKGITPEAKAELEVYSQKIPFIKNELKYLFEDYHGAVRRLKDFISQGRVMAYHVAPFAELSTQDLFRLLSEFPVFSGAPDYGRDELIKVINLPFSEVVKVVDWKSWNGVKNLFEKPATDQDLIPYMKHKDPDVRVLVAKKLSDSQVAAMKDDESDKVRKVVARRAPLQELHDYLRDENPLVRATAQKRLEGSEYVH